MYIYKSYYIVTIIYTVVCYVVCLTVLFDLAGTGPVGGYQQMPQPQQHQQYYPNAAPAADADEMRRRRLQRFANS